MRSILFFEARKLCTRDGEWEGGGVSSEIPREQKKTGVASSHFSRNDIDQKVVERLQILAYLRTG